MRPTVFALMFATIAVAPAQQFKPEKDYVLNVPEGEDSWSLAPDWCVGASLTAEQRIGSAAERARSREHFVQQLDGWFTYLPHERVRAGQQKGECIKVQFVNDSSKYGWVNKELVQPTPEDQRKQDAARKQETAKRAATAAAKREQDIKEQQYIASLPKLRGPAESVIVATSQDCAKDYARVVEFGKRNGTGVEYRKKVLELITLPCAIFLPSGTPIKVRNRDAQFVSFEVYSGPNAGTQGIALKENVQ